MIKKKSSEFHQLYNEDWEKLPIFQGWLSPVETNKFRAYCKYCRKEFRAHRTDLRTHAHSRKHQKSADAYYENEENLGALKRPPSSSSGTKRIISLSGIIDTTNDDLNDDDEHDDSRGLPDVSCSGSDQPLAEVSVSAEPQPEQEEDHQHPPCIISAEVYDIVTGMPVDRLVVYLYVFKDDKWVKLGKGYTEKDGTCSTFVSMADCEEEDVINPGQYKLCFETKMYYTLNLEESLFPFIEVPIDISDVTVEHKVKLLISPCSYVVFRGS